tara:strand:- start:6868 stop:7188 length:321 start_codon:yes stop_codon:yes gene_type:complete
MTNLLYPFFIGGSIFAGVSYLANIIQDPILASIIGSLPMGLLTSYVVRSNAFLQNYAQGVLKVLVITFVCVCFLIALLKYTTLGRILAISLSILLWAALQALRYYL